jgi:hypothetical protein
MECFYNGGDPSEWAKRKYNDRVDLAAGGNIIEAGLREHG